MLCESDFAQLGGALNDSGSSSGTEEDAIKCQVEMILEDGARQMRSVELCRGATASVLRETIAELYSVRCGGFIDSSRVVLLAAGVAIEDTQSVLAQDLHDIGARLHTVTGDWQSRLDALPSALRIILYDLASRPLHGGWTWSDAAEFPVLIESICSLCRHEVTRGPAESQDETANEVSEFLAEAVAYSYSCTPQSVLQAFCEEFC